MLEVIIVDDEPAGRRTLRECCAGESDIRVVGEYGDSRTALDGISARPAHLLFLDIQMGSLDGIELARSLAVSPPPLIVFVTAYDQHALEAFELSAVDYLLKPFDDARFRRTMERVRRRHQAETAVQRQEALDAILARLESATAMKDVCPRILADLGSRMYMLDVTQIEAAEADGNYVKLIVGRDAFHARSTLQQAERTLGSQPMLRISRSCLVNVNHVREVCRTPRGDFILVLTGGTTVTSSEGFRDTVRRRLDRMKVHAE